MCVLPTCQTMARCAGQVDDHSPDTDLVTVTIGANDVAFGGPSGCDARNHPRAEQGFVPELEPGQEEKDPEFPSVAAATFFGDSFR